MWRQLPRRIETRHTLFMKLAKVLLLLACAGWLLYAITSTPDPGDWPTFGHDPGGQRFSPLTAINRSNVSTLKVAWTFRTGDAYQPKRSKPTAFETTPLYIGGTLYIGTPLGRVIALDPVKWPRALGL